MYGTLPDGSHMATLTVKPTRSSAAATARLEARVTRDFKKTLEQAAAVTGHPTLTSFMIQALQNSARQAIEDHRQVRLSGEESANFVQALLAPPAPNAALRAAFGRYRRDVRA